MRSKVFKYFFIAIGLMVGMVVSLILVLDWKEEWIYDKFGKERVLKFMKRFEPYIIMEPGKFKDKSPQEGENETLDEDVQL